jgi:hypothetical protein
MRIAQIAPLAESVPPKLYGGTEQVIAKPRNKAQTAHRTAVPLERNTTSAVITATKKPRAAATTIFIVIISSSTMNGWRGVSAKLASSSTGA